MNQERQELNQLQEQFSALLVSHNSLAEELKDLREYIRSEQFIADIDRALAERLQSKAG